MAIMLGSALVIAAMRARAHGGGRDKLGCHEEGKRRGYSHCPHGQAPQGNLSLTTPAYR